MPPGGGYVEWLQFEAGAPVRSGRGNRGCGLASNRAPGVCCPGAAAGDQRRHERWCGAADLSPCAPTALRMQELFIGAERRRRASLRGRDPLETCVPAPGGQYVNTIDPGGCARQRTRAKAGISVKWSA